jgi:hypothetical protein
MYDKSPNANHLQLRSNPPHWEYSYAPLTQTDMMPVMPPVPGAAGYALALSDRQVRRGRSAGAAGAGRGG